jgi:hypothetical protein
LSWFDTRGLVLSVMFGRALRTGGRRRMHIDVGMMDGRVSCFGRVCCLVFCILLLTRKPLQLFNTSQKPWLTRRTSLTTPDDRPPFLAIGSSPFYPSPCSLLLDHPPVIGMIHRVHSVPKYLGSHVCEQSPRALDLERFFRQSLQYDIVP